MENEVHGDLRRLLRTKELIRLLRGDLDWIVMKALEKDRTRRYETANGFASDIQRHLNNEPVVARPPSGSYDLGLGLNKCGNLPEAESTLREALAMANKFPGNDDLNPTNILADLAKVLTAEGKLSEAQALMEEAQAIRNETK